MAPTSRTSPLGVSRLLTLVALLIALAAVFYFYPWMVNDVQFAGWVLFGLFLVLIGVIGAWTNRTGLVSAAGVLLTGFAIAAMWSIGPLIAPAALLLLVAAWFSHRAGPRVGVREAIRADPPSEAERRRKTWAGMLAIVGGVALIVLGVFVLELFVAACPDETLACTLEIANWSGIGLTLFGLIGVTVGSWLVWRQSYIERVLDVPGSAE